MMGACRWEGLKVKGKSLSEIMPTDKRRGFYNMCWQGFALIGDVGLCSKIFVHGDDAGCILSPSASYKALKALKGLVKPLRVL